MWHKLQVVVTLLLVFGTCPILNHGSMGSTMENVRWTNVCMDCPCWCGTYHSPYMWATYPTCKQGNHMSKYTKVDKYLARYPYWCDIKLFSCKNVHLTTCFLVCWCCPLLYPMLEPMHANQVSWAPSPNRCVSRLLIVCSITSKIFFHYMICSTYYHIHQYFTLILLT